ncbi:MAG TPA: S8 family serine peptidase [Ilumatobacteraceae bacterium]|nr:S8 family serine peptidase [Ilumatobacteraceae bacterium]
MDETRFEQFGGSSEIGTMDVLPKFVVEVEDQAALERTLTDLDRLGLEPLDVWDDALFGFVVALDAADMERVRSLPDVEQIGRDAIVTASGTQVDAPWGLDRIDQRSLPLDSGYSSTATGVGVKAYVIDTGLWMSHVEFAGRAPYGAYWNFGDGTGVWDCNGHGTHVAGTVGGTTYGVAKGVTIIPVKVLTCNGSGSDSSVIAGINWVIDDHVAGTPAVANMSLGGSPSAVLDSAVQAMIADGITVVIAAGNEAQPTCGVSPARVPAAITVAASEFDDDDADYSNYGSCNDLFAPGSEILSAYPSATDTASAFLSGTSMAAPHVSGAAALVLQGSPSAAPEQVWVAIEAATTKGVLTECCGDPDKLLYVGAATSAPLLTVDRVGNGSGTVTSSPAGISCGSSCSASFASETAVTLTATPSVGSSFAGWSDACSGVSTSCLVSMTAARSVTATFVADALLTGTPARLYDSRNGAGPRSPGSITHVQVAGVGGVPPGATGAILNVTAVEAQASGFLTVYPCDGAVPDGSNLNYAAGQTIANAVFAKLGADGQVCIYTYSAAHLIVDVNGYLPATSDITPVAPARFFDSRNSGGPRADGSVTAIAVGGRPGYPSNPAAVTLNVTAIDAQSAGFMTVFPCGNAIPEASNLNFATGQTIANAVVARVGDSGLVCVYVSGSAGLIVDVNGFVPLGSTLAALNPARLFDSRSNGGARPAGSITEVQVAGLGGVPSTARTAMLNVTAIGPSSAGFMTVFPCGTPVPTASNLNYASGQTIPNAVAAKIGDGGRVCIYTSAAAHLVVDVNGNAS